MIRTLRQTANTWHLLLKALQIIKEHRDTLMTDPERLYQDIYSINSILILDIAATVEGSIAGLLVNHISNGQHYKEANKKTDLPLRKILDDLIDQVHRGQWKDLAKKTKLIVDIELPKIDEDIWESIKYMFDFRNILAHGGIIITGIDLISNVEVAAEIKEEERRELHNRRDLFTFLKKKQLIDENDINHILKWDFLNSNIADFFVSKGQQFMKAFYINYVDKYPNNRFAKRDLEIITEMTDR